MTDSSHIIGFSIGIIATIYIVRWLERSTEVKTKEQLDRAKLYRKTIPLRILKAVLAFILVMPLMPVCFAIICFEDDEWPWYRLLVDK